MTDMSDSMGVKELIELKWDSREIEFGGVERWSRRLP